MKLSSLGLEAFYAVSRALSFSRAAAELRLTQPALSQRILNLEDTLGARLFIRAPSGLRLTESGRVLLRYCRNQSGLEEEALTRLARITKKAAGSGLGGTVRIGGFSSVMRSVVMPRLERLVRDHPGVRIEAFVRELSELPGLLRQGQLDFVVLDRSLDDAGLETRHLGFEENVLVESKSKAARRDVYLDHDPEDETTHRFFALQGRNQPAVISRSYLDDIYGILDGVAMGWGRAVVPAHLVRGREGLRVVPGYKPLRAPWVLHYYAQPYYSELHERLLRCLDPKFPRNPGP